MKQMERGWRPRSTPRGPSPVLYVAIAATIAVALVAACSHSPAAKPVSTHRDLTIGVALPRGNEAIGLNALRNGLRAESLITLAQDGRPEPRLAAAWTRSPDGLAWTFTLAPNIYFQDGRRATATLLAPLLQAAIADPRNKGQRPNLAEVVSLTAPDEATIVIRTRVPRALLLDQLSDLTIPGNPKDGALGAFIRESEQGDMLSFRAFDKYYRGRPGVGRVTYRSYRSLRAAWAAMMRGETDAIYELGRDAGEFVQAESGVRVYPFVRPFAASLVFNVARPALRSPAVRRALGAMVNKQEIVSAAYRGHATIANGPLWPSHWALEGRKTADAAADGEHLLAQAPAPRLRFTCLVVPTLPPFERIALTIQKQLYDHGVDMQLEAVTIEQMQQRLSAGDFDAVLFESLGRTPNWIYGFWHSPVGGPPPAFNTGYRSADAPLDRLLASQNDGDVRSALAEVYRAMENDPPAIFIAWPQVGRAVSRDFVTPAGEGRDVLASSALWMLRPAGAQP